MEKVVKKLSTSCKLEMIWLIAMSIVIGVLLYHVIELQNTVTTLEKICEASVNY